MSKRVVVIGGGTGGYPAALILAQRGLQVTLVEKDRLGGTCLNRGCIPTKVLLQAAELLRQIKHGPSLGVAAERVAVNLARLRQHQQNVVDSLVQGVEKLCAQRRVQVIAGTAAFETPRRLRIKETGAAVEAEAVIIATGSRPAWPDLPGLDGAGVWSSDQALTAEEIPPSLAILGGGAIGLEFAQVFSALGARVQVLEMLPQLLPHEDAEVAAEMAGALRADGIEVHLGATVKEIGGPAGEKKISFEVHGQAKTLTVAAVLAAVGRRPHTMGLQAERIGVKLNRGAIVVDEYFRTGVEGVYAVGDVLGGVMLAHLATAQGEAAAEHILGQGRAFGGAAVPRCLYTWPEVAAVGLTEAEARERWGEVTVGRFPLQFSGKGRILGGPGWAKVVAEAGRRRIVGIHLVGPRVTEIIGGAALALNLECTAEELAHAVFPHPTVSETLREAALAVEGLKVHAA